MTGPVLAQTRPITNVAPEDVPGRVLPESEGAASAQAHRNTPVPLTSSDGATNANEPSTAGASAPQPPMDFSFSEIQAAIGDLRKKFNEGNKTGQ